MKGVTVEKNHMNTVYMVSPSVFPHIHDITQRLPTQKILTHVRYVAKTLNIPVAFSYIKKLMLERNFTNVSNVRLLSFVFEIFNPT